MGRYYWGVCGLACRDLAPPWQAAAVAFWTTSCHKKCDRGLGSLSGLQTHIAWPTCLKE
jgi:hypothetical protein